MSYSNIHGRKIPTGKVKNNSRITSDQKKIRVLSYLQSKSKPVSQPTLLKGITKNSISLSAQYNTFLNRMIEDKLIERKEIGDGSRNGYNILEEGEKLIDIIKLIKKFNPDNPILSLDLFHMTDDEKEKINKPGAENIEDFKKIFDFNFEDTDKNIKKIKEDLENIFDCKF